MKKMLMLASVASMIDQFNMPNIQLLQEMGYEVHVACNFIEGNTCSKQTILELKNKLKSMGIKCYQIDFSRNIMDFRKILKSYRQVYLLIKREKYEFIHCHSPIGGVIGRLVGHRTRTKVIYTAHGFHFFKGAPIQNWILYYPVERFLSRYTDILITINKEDYQRAKTFKAKRIEYVPGVGVDIQKFRNCEVDINKKREELGIPKDAKVLLSVGELTKRKNHQIVIRALAELKREDIYYIICGQGKEKDNLKKLARNLNVENQLFLLGYRADVKELYKIAELFIFPSLQEGLPVALMEAMASGLPCIVSDIRGNRDLINYQGGELFTSNTVLESIKKIMNATEDELLTMGEYNLEKIKQFDRRTIDMLMIKQYKLLSKI